MGVDSLEVADLYKSLSRQLEQIVRLDVFRAPRPVVEDACQFAWGRLIVNRERVRSDTALSWLARTASREAIRALRREQRCLSLDAALDHETAADDSPGPAELVEWHERLEELKVLPERQQRLAWLHAFGFSYEEAAEQTGLTKRTVERQLLKSKRALRQSESAER